MHLSRVVECITAFYFELKKKNFRQAPEVFGVEATQQGPLTGLDIFFGG